MLLVPIDVPAVAATLRAEVQLFRTHRVVETHEWCRSGNGPDRRVEVSGDQGTWTALGPPTPAELELGLEDADRAVVEQDVFALAARWSVDPTTLASRLAEAPTGSWCRLSDEP